MSSVFTRVYITLLFYVFFNSGIYINAQVPEFSAFHYNSENIGLSHNTVLNMVTDSYGFVWVSTMDGLNRFDGKGVKVFRHLPDDSTSLSNSFIHGLYELKNGDFLVGTRDGGLNIIDPKTEKITRINRQTYPDSNIPDAPVNVTFEDSKGFLWVGFFSSTIGYLDYKTKSFYSTNLIEKGTRERIYSTNSILELKDGSFLLTSLNGIFYVSGEEIKKFRASPYSNLEIIAERLFFSDKNLSPNANNIYIDSEGGIWVNIVTDDLRRLNTTMLSGEVKKSIASGVEKSSVKNIYLERGDFLIKGQTEGNIKAINKKTREEQIIKVVDVEGAVGASTLYEDKFGNLWFYTWGGGFFRLSERKGIKLINSKKMSSLFILGFEESKDRIWVATNKGLSFINKNEEVFTLREELNKKLGSIWSLEKDDLGLWITTRTNGLFLIPQSSIQTNKIELISFNTDNSLVLMNNVHQVLRDSRGWLWLGYEGEGIQIIKNTAEWISGQPANVLTLKKGGTESSINSNNIRKVYEDKTGNIWIATTDNGFNYIAFSDGAISTIQFFQNNGNSSFRLSHKDGRGVYQQNDTTFWFASYGGGITRWISGTDQLLNLRTSEGLSNNSVYGILGDTNPDYIWMSTNNGLGRLDTKTLSFSTFREGDGLQNNEFNTGAYFQSSSGKLYFGGVNGFNIIDTRKFSVDEQPPKVFLTRINLFNEEIDSDSSALFKKRLKLSHKENFLSFEFAALYYEDPLENKYAHKLEGVDPEWVYSGNRNFADYPNLSPGDYTFRVKAANKYGIWNEEGVLTHIRVLSPWWQTWWFRTFYILFFLGSSIGLIRYYSQRKLKEQLREMELKHKLRSERERISRDLHDHVGAQLANIITGLALIDKYAEVDEREKSIKLMKSLKGDAEVTIKQLRETIWALNQNELNLEGFTNHLKMYFKNQSALTEQLSISMAIEDGKATVLSAAQALNLFRIIQEASQNTLKYANANNFEIFFKRINGNLNISIKDDGTFKADKESFNGGYGMKNMQKRAQEIKGKVEVNIEKGTEIRINIPV